MGKLYAVMWVCCRWGSIMSTIGALERLLRKHQVPIAIIDGPKVRHT